MNENLFEVVEKITKTEKGKAVMRLFLHSVIPDEALELLEAEYNIKLRSGATFKDALDKVWNNKRIKY